MSTYNKTVFDPSKFTYVGNPEVTKDGIASGFSRNVNYLKTPSIPSVNNSWEIVQKIKVNSSVTETNVFWQNLKGTDLRTSIEMFIVRGNALACSIKKDNQYIATSGNGRGIIEIGVSYICKLQFTGSKYILSYAKEGEDFKQIWEVVSSQNTYSQDNTIGYSFMQGSIDLKEFKITTGGVDIYNPDAFTVVGNPTISNDGILSNMSRGMYVKANEKPIIYNNFEIDVTTTFGVGSQQSIITPNYPINGQSFALIKNGVNLLCFMSSNGTDWDLASTITCATDIEENTRYSVKFGYDGTKYYCKVKRPNSNTYEETWSKVSNVKCLLNHLYLCGPNWIANTGSIDLKQFSISVDGKEVFKGTKYIPLEEVFIGTKVIVCFYPILNDIEHLPKIVTDILGIDDILLAIDPEVQQTRVDISDLIKELYIKTTDKFIRRWELDFSLPYDASLTLQQRRQRVLNKLARKKTLTWENLKLLIQNNVDNPQFYIINDSGNYHLTIMVQTNNYKSLESALDNIMPAYLTYDIVVTEYFKRCGSFICGTNPL